MNTIDSIKGLTHAEVSELIARGLVNRQRRSVWAEYLSIVVRNLFTHFNALVVPAAVALFLLGDPRGAWAVSTMAVLNTVISLVQEIRAKYHLDRLDLLAETRARVVRDGIECIIPASGVVQGDLIRLASGDPVVADGQVLTSEFLEIDEALLTGESEPVPRRPGELLLSGSFAVAGSGVYRADQVGDASFANRTSASARRYRHTPSPIQRTLDAIVRVLTIATVVLCCVYVVLGFVRDLPTLDVVQMIAATITSLVPQGLVLMTTMALTLGAVKLTGQGAIVQQLGAVEAMASVDIICTDKTGTLTTSNLAVDHVEVITGNEPEVIKQLAMFAWSTVDAGNRSVQGLRSRFPKPEESFTLINQVPFKSQNRFSAVQLRTGASEEVLFLGSLDALLPRFPKDLAQILEARFKELLPTGLRLLVFAVGSSPPGPCFGIDMALRPIALIALRDELREDIDVVLSSLAAQDVRVKIVSGDHPETLRAILSQVKSVFVEGSVCTGVEFESAVDRDGFAMTSSVFGRVTPQQKFDVITALQRQGQHVAMIGDGVNDILAIKKADLGIAMGAGAAATKTVAGLVLENNRFELLPIALAEGRTVLTKVRLAAKIFLLKNSCTLILVIFLVGIMREAFPYLPQQVTLLNALTIGVPAILIVLSKAPSDQRSARAFLSEVGQFVVGMSLTLGAAGLAAWFVGNGTEEKRTLLLSTLVLAGLANVAFLGEGRRLMIGWVVPAFLIYLTAMYVSPLSNFFALKQLLMEQWLLVAVFAVAGFLGGRLLAGSDGFTRFWASRLK